MYSVYRRVFNIGCAFIFMLNWAIYGCKVYCVFLKKRCWKILGILAMFFR